jgi:hypothetical protein
MQVFNIFNWSDNVMKYFMSVVLIILGSNLMSCTAENDSQIQTKEIADSTLNRTQQKQDNNILSRDYETADKSLKKAVLEKDIDTIKLGLKSSIFTIKQKTVDAIIKMKDEIFVPNLVEALQENQGIIAGGTESDLMQKDFDRKIVTALEALTKLDFGAKESLTADKIEEIIKKSQDWVDIQKKK